ncbi:molecular chaperone [Comamonas sp. GB3 AK4-5]|uniref:fimbrial biogenesis chaperone n=1 Tax=Comamonas sp. GB3 AK4-5 TaxID=3231487 RepID=UPI00351EE397
MIKKILFLVATTCVGLSNSWAAFSVEATRLVYEESNKSEQVTVANKGGKNYLVQSWIEDASGKHTMDFLAVAPLFKLKGDSKQSIQIIRNSAQPTDRESLYWINIKFVEPTSKDGVNVLRYSLVNRIKLLHRPDVLRDVQVAEEVKKLKVAVEGKQLVLENPSAVYINTNNIYVNEQAVENPGYIAPHSSARIDLEEAPKSKSLVRVNYINDYGVSLNQEFGIQ